MNPQYNGALTREQFLFREMRIVARLCLDHCAREDCIERICKDNLFQYPTERVIRQQARACFRRLDALGDDPYFMNTIANASLHDAKQVVLLSIMRQNPLVAEFMVQVIGNKYRSLDMTFSRKDINVFFQDLRQQNDHVASWSDATVERIKGVLSRFLIETEYIKNVRENKLYPVLASEDFVRALQRNDMSLFLPAFYVFE